MILLTEETEFEINIFFARRQDFEIKKNAVFEKEFKCLWKQQAVFAGWSGNHVSPNFKSISVV